MRSNRLRPAVDDQAESPTARPNTVGARLRHHWIRHRSVDIIAPVFFICVWVVMAHFGWAPIALTEVPPDARRTLYQILASIAVTMSGVTLTSISLLLTILQIPISGSDRLAPNGDRRLVAAAFLAVLPWLGAMFVAALVSIATDTNAASGYWWLQLTLIALAAAAVCAIFRVIWILRRVLTAAANV